MYEYCERKGITYFIKLPGNENLKRHLKTPLPRPVGRSPKSGIQVKIVEIRYCARSWSRSRRVICKIEWHDGELYERVQFIEPIPDSQQEE